MQELQELQELQEVGRPVGLRWPQSLFISRNTFIVFLVIIIGPALLYSDLSITRWRGLPGAPIASTTVVTNGANLWAGDTKITASVSDSSTSGSQEVSISPLFESYYNSHNGVTSLGSPVTPAIPDEQGWIQFFASGALLLPSAQQTYRVHTEDRVGEFVDTRAKGPGSGITRLPLIQTLLTAGSEAPVGAGGRSSLTYVDLRKATNPDLMLPVPATSSSATPTAVESQKVFIKGGTRDGQDVGHLVPLPLWSYINRADVSPDGWEEDFGAPLTEAIPFTVTSGGRTHQLLVQVFWRDGLVLDQTALDAGQPQIERLDTGLAYLDTFGATAFGLGPVQTVWSQGETALFDAPGTGHAVAHVGQDFPLTLLGNAIWKMGTLWCHVQWTVPKRTATGWIPATAITYTSPGKVPGWASFDLLSPDLAAYLGSMGNNVSAVVYDVTRQRYYGYQANAEFITGSAIKVPIMLTLLDMTEREHRQPNAYEMGLLTTMIENSDNDSAGTLYLDEIGGASGVASFMQRIGVSGVNPFPGGDFGWSSMSPLAMVNLLARLHDGSILTAQDRQLALYLMENIQSNQQAGVGDSAPSGATVAMKDGWVVAPDGLWAMNSSGIVTVGHETYIISVYTADQYAVEDGQEIARQVCGAVASLLS